MRIETLRVDGVRNLRQVEIAPAPGVNVLVGPNGAGKTSMLESLNLLAVGRSFRGGRRLAWIARDAEAAEIFAVSDRHRLGLRQSRDGWEGRVDGRDAKSRADLTACLPLFLFHPDSHALIAGEPEHRRRLLDVGVFHVEHQYLACWRRYRRALQQRNAGLRLGVDRAQLRVWEQAMVADGERLNQQRQAYVACLQESLAQVQSQLQARIPALALSLHAGWPEDEGLAEALDRARASDREAGFTRLGPQRADLKIRDADGLVAGRLSRGQEKIAALCLVLAQALEFARRADDHPVFALDDMASELDAEHERRMADWLVGAGWQVWVTALEAPDWLGEPATQRLFHVEQGRVTAVL